MRRTCYPTKNQCQCQSQNQRHLIRRCQFTSMAICARLSRTDASAQQIASAMSPGQQATPCSLTQLRQPADACQSRERQTPTSTIKLAQITLAGLAMAAATVGSAGLRTIPSEPSPKRPCAAASQTRNARAQTLSTAPSSAPTSTMASAAPTAIAACTRLTDQVGALGATARHSR